MRNGRTLVLVALVGALAACRDLPSPDPGDAGSPGSFDGGGPVVEQDAGTPACPPGTRPAQSTDSSMPASGAAVKMDAGGGGGAATPVGAGGPACVPEAVPDSGAASPPPPSPPPAAPPGAPATSGGCRQIYECSKSCLMPECFDACRAKGCDSARLSFDKLDVCAQDACGLECLFGLDGACLGCVLKKCAAPWSACETHRC